MVAEGWGRKKFVLWGRSTVKNKNKKGGGGGMKILALIVKIVIYIIFSSRS